MLLMLKAEKTILIQRDVKSSDCSCQQQGLAWCCLLLSLLHILQRSMTALDAEVAASCCSWWLKRFTMFEHTPFAKAFSPSCFLFYSLIPAVLMSLAWSPEYLARLTVDCTSYVNNGTVQEERLCWVYPTPMHNPLKHSAKELTHILVRPYGLASIWNGALQ